MSPMTMAALAATLRQSRAQGCANSSGGRDARPPEADDKNCGAPCRIAEPPPTRPQLRWLERATRVSWCWVAGAADCNIDLRELRDCDCICLLWAAQRYALMGLEHDDGEAIERVEAALRLALGPGRTATVEIMAPTRPDWLPARSSA